VVLLVIALVTGVVLVVVVIVLFVGGVKLLPLGAVDDEMAGVTALKAAPR
jgi:hypothetical protein